MSPGDGTPPVYAPLLLARDFQTTLGFYEIVLNQTSTGAAPYAKIATPKSTLSIVDARWWAQASGMESPLYGGAGASNFVLMIQVGDVEAEFERLAERGYPFLHPPTFRGKMGLRTAALRDPDGRTVVLSTPVP